MKKFILLLSIAVVLFGQATTASAGGHKKGPKAEKPAKEHKARGRHKKDAM